MHTPVFSLVLVSLALLCPRSPSAETITATCYAPKGQRINFLGRQVQEQQDSYSGSNPTFFFSTKDPKFLVESWQAALPFPDMITRERVDEIMPPSVTKSIVLTHSNSVIHAVSMDGRDAFTTTLYLEDGFGIFTRIRVDKGGLVDYPMGAIYSAKCNINVLP